VGVITNSKAPAAQGASGFSANRRNRKLDRETPDLVRSNRAVFACRFFSFGG
jgi:hypothetical protein